jgi:DNA-binding CsgD family transcriptional regulator
LLTRFGVSAEAETVWRALLDTPDITVANLRTETGLTAAEIDAAITQLGDASLVRGTSSPSGVVVIDPALALESHMARAEHAAADQAMEFAAIRLALPQLVANHETSRSKVGDYQSFEILVDKVEIQRQIDLATDRAADDVRSLDHTPTTELSADEIDTQIGLIGRGVRDRALLPPTALSRPGILEHYLAMQQRGHDARAHPGVATRLFVIDRDLAVLAVDPQVLARGAFMIRLRSLIDVLATMYDEMWKNASPIFSDTADGDAPVGRHARILELIALGSKDEAIARTLGIGVRTIRRDVADLKTGLAVSTRTEIVAAAVRKGWL